MHLSKVLMHGSQIKEAVLMINSKIDDLNSKIESMEQPINNRLNDEAIEIKNKLNLDLLEQNKRIEDAELKISLSLISNMDLRLSEFERVSNSKDVIINGIPNSVACLESALQCI